MRVTILHHAVGAHDSAADQDVLIQAEVVAGAVQRLGHSWERLPCSLDLESLRRQWLDHRPDVIFNLVESLGGSDALAHLVPALLDVWGIPYTGSPTEALWATNNKLLAKRRLRQSGLPTPDWHVLGADNHAAQTSEVLTTSEVSSAAAPYVLKSVTEHASFGLDEDCIVQADGEATVRTALRAHCARLGRACFAEQYIVGREFNLSLLGGPEGPETLPAAEIDFSAFPPGKPRMVGHRAKWEEGSFEFEHTHPGFDFPAEDDPLLDQLRALALRCWRLFGLRGYARVDFRVDSAGQPWILEINANPCLSPDAGFAGALERAGLGFETAVSRILAEAFPPGSGRTCPLRLGLP